MNMNNDISGGPMLNAYPDSMGGTLYDIVDILGQEEFLNVFDSLYILPSIFNTDLDRGFSVIDYKLNENLVTMEDLAVLRNMRFNLKLDFVLNHLSTQSTPFQDILKNGKESSYLDFFLDWNKFWDGFGDMTEAGYIQPYAALLEDMFFRKPGLPILMVKLPDGSDIPYWNTFYQKVIYDKLNPFVLLQTIDIEYPIACILSEIVNRQLELNVLPQDMNFEAYSNYKNAVINLLEGKKKYLGQMDLNINSPMVWQYYDDTLQTLADYGASIVRLDAFAYASKIPGKRNFLNEPETWELLQKIQQLADQYNLTLLPEIHSSYSEHTYEKLAEKGYITYDFFLPGLIIDALESGSGELLAKWAKELYEKNIGVINMLGCHDGIPLLDLKGLLSEERINALINIVVSRGGLVKELHGQKNIYYQVNATYYSALGNNDQKMLLARALQIFMPGKPQVWYLDLFAGSNDYEAVTRADGDGHKDINRTNLTRHEIADRLKSDVVKQQLNLLRLRNTCPAFGMDANLQICSDGPNLYIQWKKGANRIKLSANLQTFEYCINEIT